MSDKSISDILHDIQVKLAVPKSRYNKFGNYSYRSAEDIVDAVKALLPNGYSLLLSDEMIMLGNRFYIKASAILFGGEDNKEQVRSCGFAREPDIQKGMSESQITGAASSYARKYALNGLFAIDDGVDADSQDNSFKVFKAPEEVIKAPEKTPEQKLAAAMKWTDEYIAKVLIAPSLAELEEQNSDALERLTDNYPELAKKITNSIKEAMLKA